MRAVSHNVTILCLLVPSRRIRYNVGDNGGIIKILGIIAVTPLVFALNSFSWLVTMLVSGVFGGIVTISVLVFVRAEPPESRKTEHEPLETMWFNELLAKIKLVLREIVT